LTKPRPRPPTKISTHPRRPSSKHPFTNSSSTLTLIVLRLCAHSGGTGEVHASKNPPPVAAPYRG
jgi:hypothetical protein